MPHVVMKSNNLITCSPSIILAYSHPGMISSGLFI